jgi:hypothetical protein
MQGGSGTSAESRCGVGAVYTNDLIVSRDRKSMTFNSYRKPQLVCASGSPLTLNPTRTTGARFQFDRVETGLIGTWVDMLPGYGHRVGALCICNGSVKCCKKYSKICWQMHKS